MAKADGHNEQWKTIKLGDDDLFDFVKGEQINGDLLSDNGQFPMYNGGTEPSGYLEQFNTHENEIIMSEGGNSCGYVNYVTTKFWRGGHCYLVRLCKENSFDKLFVYYLLKFHEENLMKLRVGSGLPNIQKKDLFKYIISYPDSLPAQRRIAAILSAADKVIEQTRQLIGKYKSIKQGMMEDLLKPKEGWKMVRLGDCCITELGKTLDEGRNTGEYRPYLCALNVLWGKIDRTTIKQMRIEDDELNRYAVKRGDLLVCEGGEIGRCAIWDYDDTMYYQNALHRVRFFNGYDSMFFMYLLCYYNDLNLLEQHGKGLTIKHLNQTSFRSIPVSVPDLSEQRRIAKILSGIDRKIEAEEKVLEKYEKMKKGLMERLLNE